MTTTKKRRPVRPKNAVAVAATSWVPEPPQSPVDIERVVKNVYANLLAGLTPEMLAGMKETAPFPDRLANKLGVAVNTLAQKPVPSDMTLNETGQRLAAVVERLIGECGSITCSVERLTGSMPTPRSPSATSRDGGGQIGELNRQIDTLFQFLDLLGECSAALNRL